MSSFSLQNSQIRGALEAAGMPSAQAATIANILGNAAQTMRHEGVIEHDRTPKSMRMVDADKRRHVFKELDFKRQDPDHRRRLTPDGEERAAPVPEPDVLITVSPQQSPDAFRVAGGAYTSANGIGDATKIDLNVRHDGPCLFADPATNTLRGKTLRAECGGRDDGRVRLWIEERDAEAVWKLQMVNISRTKVVTGIEHQPGRGLVVTYQEIDAWTIGQPTRRLVPIPAAGDGVSITAPIIIGKRDDLDEWEKDERASFRQYQMVPGPFDDPEDPMTWEQHGVAIEGDPIPDVQNPFRYIRPGQFVAIAQDANGDWAVVESEIGCGESSGHHGAEITREGLLPENFEAGVGQIAGGDENAPQVLVQQGGCTRWVSTKLLRTVAAEPEFPDSPLQSDGSGGIEWTERVVWALPFPDAFGNILSASGGVGCSDLGQRITGGSVQLRSGMPTNERPGRIELTGACRNRNIGVVIAVDNCPAPSPSY